MPRAGEAYATLITSDDFVDGAEVLLHSLKKTGTSRELVVLVTEEISKGARRRLLKIADKVHKVEKIANPCERADASWKGSGYTKLRLWSLTAYSCIVYIDADALVLRNIDELFDLEIDFAAAPDIFPPDKFNAGVLVLRPDLSIFERMLKIAPHTETHDGGDTGFLNAFFNDWFTTRPSAGRLPFRFNAQRTLFYMTHQKNPGYWNSIKPIYIVHFVSSPKPWQDTKAKGELELLWWQFALDLRTSAAGGFAAFLGDSSADALSQGLTSTRNPTAAEVEVTRSAHPAANAQAAASALDLLGILQQR